MSRFLGLVVVVAAVGALGCADVQIRKVPNRADYPQWTNAMQMRADNMEGLRFYMSRPYVTVHRPFPVGSKTYLVDAIISPNGDRARVVGDLKNIKDIEHAGISPELIDVNRIWANRSGAGGAAPSFGPDRAHGKDEKDAKPPADPADPADPGQPSPPPASPSGITDIRMYTDISAIPELKLQDYFQLVYLPDFSQQYVVDADANLASLGVSLTKGPGDVLMGMGVQINNEAITRPLVDTYTGLVKQFGGVLTNAMGLPIGTTPTAGPGVAGMVDPTDKAHGLSEEEKKALAGTVVTLRVHVVKMASPGVYPILKPDEMLESRNCLRRLGLCDRCGRACDGTCGGTLATRGKDTHVLPVYPYSRVAYQVFSTIIVEHLVSDPGMARNVNFDTDPRSGPGAAPASGGGSPAPKPLSPRAIGLQINRLVGGVDACRLDFDGGPAVATFAPTTATKPDEITTLQLVVQAKAGGPLDATQLGDCRTKILARIKPKFPNLQDANFTVITR